jgi:plasmid stabilization system protein ParE
MVKRKVVWSHRARIKLWEILEYYAERNKSTAYSKKLYKKLSGEAALLTKHPEIGRKTDHQFVRGLVVENFILFYEIYPNMIVVHTVWDTRQNPDSLKIK